MTTLLFLVNHAKRLDNIHSFDQYHHHNPLFPFTMWKLALNWNCYIKHFNEMALNVISMELSLLPLGWIGGLAWQPSLSFVMNFVMNLSCIKRLYPVSVWRVVMSCYATIHQSTCNCCCNMKQFDTINRLWCILTSSVGPRPGISTLYLPVLLTYINHSFHNA